MSRAVCSKSRSPPDEAGFESDGGEDTHEFRAREIVKFYLNEHGAQFKERFSRKGWHGKRLRITEKTSFEHAMAVSVAYTSPMLAFDTHDTVLAKARGVERAWIRKNLQALLVKHKPFDLYWNLVLSKGQKNPLNHLLGRSFASLDATIQGYIFIGDLVQMSFLEQVARFLQVTVILSDILYCNSAKSELLGFFKNEMHSEWRTTLGLELQREAGPHASLSAAHLHRSASLAEDLLLVNQYRKVSTHAQQFSSHINSKHLEDLRNHASRMVSEVSAALADQLQNKRSPLCSIISSPPRERESINLVLTVRSTPNSPTFRSDNDNGRLLQDLFYQALAGWTLFYEKYREQVAVLAALADVEDPFKLIRDVFATEDMLSPTLPQPVLSHEEGKSSIAEMGNMSRGVHRLAEQIESENCADVADELLSAWRHHWMYGPGFGSNSGFWKDEEMVYRPDDTRELSQPSDKDVLPRRVISMNHPYTSRDILVAHPSPPLAVHKRSIPASQIPKGTPEYNSSPNDQLMQEYLASLHKQDSQSSPCHPRAAKAKGKQPLRSKPIPTPHERADSPPARKRRSRDEHQTPPGAKRVRRGKKA